MRRETRNAKIPTTPNVTVSGKPRSFRGRNDKRNNPELVKLLEETIFEGSTQKLACERAGIHPATLCAWMQEGAAAKEGTAAREFYERIKKAKVEAIHRNVILIQKHAQKTWQAAAWLLERRCPEDWALKQRIEHSGPEGEPIPIKETLPCVKLSKEKMEKILEKVYTAKAKARERGLEI